MGIKKASVPPVADGLVSRKAGSLRFWGNSVFTQTYFLAGDLSTLNPWCLREAKDTDRRKHRAAPLGWENLKASWNSEYISYLEFWWRLQHCEIMSKLKPDTSNTDNPGCEHLNHLRYGRSDVGWARQAFGRKNTSPICGQGEFSDTPPIPRTEQVVGEEIVQKSCMVESPLGKNWSNMARTHWKFFEKLSPVCSCDHSLCAWLSSKSWLHLLAHVDIRICPRMARRFHLS